MIRGIRVPMATEGTQRDRGEVVFEQVKFICNKVSPVGFEPTIRLGGGLIDRCVFQFHHGEYGCFGG